MLRTAKRPIKDCTLRSATACIFLLVSSSAHAVVECPKPAQQVATDISLKIQSAVSSLPAASHARIRGQGGDGHT